MVPLTPAEPPDFNAFETIARLSYSQHQRDVPNDTHTQSTSNIPSITNNNAGNTSTTYTMQPHNQSTVILQQFSMITKKSTNFTNKVSGNITKIT